MIAAGAITLAGLAKFLDLARFDEALSGWTIIPPSAQPAVLVIVPAFELVLGLAWLLNVAQPACTRVMLGGLTLATAALAAQWAVRPSASCGCLGVLSRYFLLAEGIPAALGRNGILALLLAVSLRPTASPKRSARSPVSSRHGFTLLEMLLTIAALAILIAILFPALAGVQTSARAASTLLNLRQHAAIIATYTSDFADQFPALTDPYATVSVIRCQTAGVAIEAGYFAGAKLWHVGLADGYYQGRVFGPMHRSPFGPPGISGHYIMACSFLAAPEYYDALTRTVPPHQLRATRAAEVLFPVAKSLLVDFATPRSDDPRQLAACAMVDGRAGEFPPADRLPGHWTADGDIPDFYAGDRGGDGPPATPPTASGGATCVSRATGPRDANRKPTVPSSPRPNFVESALPLQPLRQPLRTGLPLRLR